MGECGLSRCGLLGALFRRGKQGQSDRTNCVPPRLPNSTDRVRQFSFPLRHWCLLGSSCEYCYVWIDRSDRGNSAAEATSRTIKAYCRVVHAAWISQPRPTVEISPLHSLGGFGAERHVFDKFWRGTALSFHW